MIAGLKATEAMLSSWSASAQASRALHRIIDLMSQDEELTVAQFCSKVEKALDRNNQKDNAASRATQVNTEQADHYIEKLRSPALQRTDLADVIERLRKDRKCRLQELDYIANALTRSGRKYRSKKDAIQDIERYANRRLDVGRRMEDTSEVF